MDLDFGFGFQIKQGIWTSLFCNSWVFNPSFGSFIWLEVFEFISIGGGKNRSKSYILIKEQTNKCYFHLWLHNLK